MESGLNTFKTCYCDFINQLVLYDDQNNTIKTYVDKIDSSDNLISDILNDMINELPTYIDTDISTYSIHLWCTRFYLIANRHIVSAGSTMIVQSHQIRPQA